VIGSGAPRLEADADVATVLAGLRWRRSWSPRRRRASRPAVVSARSCRVRPQPL